MDASLAGRSSPPACSRRQLWEEFAAAAGRPIDGLRAWLDSSATAGRMVAGYGAAAKGNTLMNAAGVRRDDLAVVVDGSVAKQGKFLPGSQVPVVAPTDLAAVRRRRRADPAVEHRRRDLGDPRHRSCPSATCWVAVPEMRALSR